MIGDTLAMGHSWLMRAVAPFISAGALVGTHGVEKAYPPPPTWWLHASACIRDHESGNGRSGSNLYGLLAGWAQVGGRGYAGDASRAEQNYRAYQLYLWSKRRFGDGWLPWKCCPGTARECGL